MTERQKYLKLSWSVAHGNFFLLTVEDMQQSRVIKNLTLEIDHAHSLFDRINEHLMFLVGGILSSVRELYKENPQNKRLKKIYNLALVANCQVRDCNDRRQIEKDQF